MHFEILSNDQYNLWNDFVATSPQGSIYAKTFYLDAIGCKYQIGVLLKKDTILGGIVLAKNEINTYSNPLFAKYLGILTRSIESKYTKAISLEQRIISDIVASLRRYKTFDYFFHPSFDNWMPFYWQGYRQEIKYTYVLKNLSDIESILKKSLERVRRNERKATKNNIYITQDIPLRDFYRINQMTFNRQGGNAPFSYKFFQRFYDMLNKHDAIKLFGATDTNNNLHAVSGIVYDKKSANLMLNGMNHSVPNLEANTLLILKTIEFACGKSQTFDFEGSMIKPIEKFYRAFGGERTPYYNIWKNNFINTAKRAGITLYKKIKYGQ